MIFRHLSLARGKTHLRAMRLLLVLSLMSIVVALARFSIMVSEGMQQMNFRLAFDTLTEFEAFLAACAACIPAMRVLARGGGNKLEFGFPENWASRISRSIRGSTSGSSTSGHLNRGRRRPSLKSVSTVCTEDCMEKSPPMPPLMQMAMYLQTPTRPSSTRAEPDWEVECAGMPVVR